MVAADERLEVSVASPHLRVWKAIKMNVPSFIVIMIVWEFIARYLAQDPLLFPSLSGVAERAWELTVSGIILKHTFHTGWRILVGILIASVLGIGIGIWMGRSRLAENFWVPILSVLLPIPALAWSPILVLWFGLGNTTMIFITSTAAAIPICFNTWTGVKTVNEVWIRAARSMNADGLRLFWRVVLPGSLPYILTGLRIGLARAWRAGVAGEMVAASHWGLGYAIFDSREELDIAFMLTGIVVIGLLGFTIEKVLFQTLEARTVIKWGMMEEAAGGRR